MEHNTHSHTMIPQGIVKKIGWLIVILSILFVIKAFKELKEYRFIGRGASETNQFTVTGKGESFIVPDVAKITFTVEKEAKTIKEANAVVDQKVKDAVSFLRDQKIDEKDIKTVTSNFYPQYDYVTCITYPCPNSQKLRGYTSSRTIEVKVRDIDSASLIVEGLAAREITNLSGPEFTVSDEDQVQREARNDAIKNAREKAEELAKELGVTIVRVVNFSESTGGMYPQQPMMYKSADMALGAGAESALPVGQNKYTSDVSIVYEIR